MLWHMKVVIKILLDRLHRLSSPNVVATDYRKLMDRNTKLNMGWAVICPRIHQSWLIIVLSLIRTLLPWGIFSLIAVMFRLALNLWR